MLDSEGPTTPGPIRGNLRSPDTPPDVNEGLHAPPSTAADGLEGDESDGEFGMDDDDVTFSETSRGSSIPGSILSPFGNQQERRDRYYPLNPASPSPATRRTRNAGVGKPEPTAVVTPTRPFRSGDYSWGQLGGAGSRSRSRSPFSHGRGQARESRDRNRTPESQRENDAAVVKNILNTLRRYRSHSRGNREDTEARESRGRNRHTKPDRENLSDIYGSVDPDFLQNRLAARHPSRMADPQETEIRESVGRNRDEQHQLQSLSGVNCSINTTIAENRLAARRPNQGMDGEDTEDRQSRSRDRDTQRQPQSLSNHYGSVDPAVFPSRLAARRPSQRMDSEDMDGGGEERINRAEERFSATEQVPLSPAFVPTPRQQTQERTNTRSISRSYRIADIVIPGQMSNPPPRSAADASSRPLRSDQSRLFYDGGSLPARQRAPSLYRFADGRYPLFFDNVPLQARPTGNNTTPAPDVFRRNFSNPTRALPPLGSDIAAEQATRALQALTCGEYGPGPVPEPRRLSQTSRMNGVDPGHIRRPSGGRLQQLRGEMAFPPRRPSNIPGGLRAEFGQLTSIPTSQHESNETRRSIASGGFLAQFEPIRNPSSQQGSSEGCRSVVLGGFQAGFDEPVRNPSSQQGSNEDSRSYVPVSSGFQPQFGASMRNPIYQQGSVEGHHRRRSRAEAFSPEAIQPGRDTPPRLRRVSGASIQGQEQRALEHDDDVE